jgi:D-alanine-D-alanine ligase
MKKKIRVAVLFGGRSAEHEVSLQSAKNIIEAIDKEKYDVILIGIDKKGGWHLNAGSQFLLHAENPKLVALNSGTESKNVTLVPYNTDSQLLNVTSGEGLGSVDVVFPVLHGTYGEDGTMQGLLKLANIPFVGPSVLGSAIAMDKDVSKRLLRDADIPVTKFFVYHKYQRADIHFKSIEHAIGTPFFVKPANLGSSVGVVKVYNKGELENALDEAFQFDHKILIEQYVAGREIECSVLGNEDPIASVPGEILPQHEFYSYEAKYIDEKGATLKIPAELPQAIVQRIQKIAIRAFQVLCCEGMARVDCFLKENGDVLVNEINTIPGFTKISMYPKLWEASGISYAELIDRLIQLAIERFERDQRLKTNYDS